MLVVPIALSMIGVAVANESSVTAEAAVAETAVLEAEAAVQRADAQRALWTSAQDALRKARRALQEGNSAMAIEQARIAQQHSELGIAQKHYPLFR